MKRLPLWFLFLFLTACRQELQTDPALPAVTSAFATAALQPTPLPATPTPVFSPAQALASGPINIITIGDDVTRGDGDQNGRGYPGRLLELASHIRPGSTVVNFAQSGWTSDELIHGDGELAGQLLRAVDEVQSAVAQRRAAVVLVWVGGHDLWRLYTGTAPVSVEEEAQDAQRFENNMDIIIFELRASGAEVIVARLDDQAKRPAKTRSETYPDISADELERMTLQTQRYNEIISEKAELYNALTVDFYATDIFIQSDTLDPDGFHPNPAGYDLIAQAWYKSLIKILP